MRQSGSSPPLFFYRTLNLGLYFRRLCPGCQSPHRLLSTLPSPFLSPGPSFCVKFVVLHPLTMIPLRPEPRPRRLPDDSRSLLLFCVSLLYGLDLETVSSHPWLRERSRDRTAGEVGEVEGCYLTLRVSVSSRVLSGLDRRGRESRSCRDRK